MIPTKMYNTNEANNLIYQIIHSAFNVYNELHGGLLESVYESALVYELQLNNISVDQQKELPVWYKGIILDKKYRMDIVVDNVIIIELKAVAEILPEHRMQLFNYLRLTHIPMGILINFSLDDGVKFEKYKYEVEQNTCHAF
jgi:GxxExxY protein